MAVFDDLGNDEAKNILSRLPLQLLMRSMQVSKRWKELIEEIVLKRQEKMKGLILVNFVSVLPGMYIPQYSYASVPHADVYALNLNLEEYIPVNHFTIRDCCNGLLLCFGTSAAAVNDEEDEEEELEPRPANYYVCNPVTRKWARVPDSPAAYPDQHDVLAYDPALSLDFKVLRWPRATAQRQQDFADLDVYSSSSGTWSRRRVIHQRKNITYPRALSSTFSVFIKGVVFRLADPNVVVAVDVSEDRIPPAKVINLPSQANDKPSHRCLGKWRHDSGFDSLCYIDYNKKRINVWVLEDASRKRSPWVLKRALSVEMLVRAIPRASGMENPFFPVTFHGEREEIILELPEGVLSFNLRTSRVQEVYPIDYLRRRAFPFREVVVYPFSASFSSP